MRTILLAIVVASLAAPVAAAEPADRLPSGRAVVSSGKLLPLKGGRAGNSCAAYGPGFAKVDGTDTCVKIGGTVSIGASVGGNAGPR
jgi:Porin subfamily